MNNLDQVTLDKVVRVYSGRPGCMCGCKGRYQEGMAGKRMLTNMKAFAGTEVGLYEEIVGEDLDGNRFISLESETRNYTVYFK